MSEEYPKIEVQQIEAALTPRQKDGSNNAEVIPRDKDVFVRCVIFACDHFARAASTRSVKASRHQKLSFHVGICPRDIDAFVR